MGWLDIFDWEVGIKKASESNEDIGSVGRAFDGGWVDGRRDRKKNHKFTTAPLVEEDAETLFNLVRGLGETWTFESATDEEYGSKGTGVASGSAWTRGTSGGGIWGDAYVDVLTSAYFEPNITLPDEWTIMVGKFFGSWTSYALRDNGDYFVAGVKNTGNDPDLWIDTATTGRPRFEGKNPSGTPQATSYDQIVILPYRASDNFLAAYTAMTTTPQGGFPFLTCTGDYFRSSSSVVKKLIGASVKMSPLQSNVGGTFNHVGRVVDFELKE